MRSVAVTSGGPGRATGLGSEQSSDRPTVAPSGDDRGSQALEGAQLADPARTRAPQTALDSTVEVLSLALEVSRFGCGAVEDIEPQALGMTCRMQVPATGPKAVLTVQFSGRRTDGPGDAGETFNTSTVVDSVLPGSGQVSVTARVNVPTGQWEVLAVPVLTRPGQPPQRLPAAHGQGSTAFAPLVQQLAPGVRFGAWPALVLLGTILALLTQALLARHVGLPVGRLLAVTLVACVLGVIGAKVYYLLTHRRDKPGVLQPGMSIQGFVLVAVCILVSGTTALGLQLGAVLDVTGPGLLLGMAVGRLGCFFAGCCVGRPTSSRWGVWSSDRRVGTRRIPVQLLESASAAAVGLISLLLVAQTGQLRGLVFIGSMAASTLVRQLLFPLRQLARQTRYGRQVMVILTALVLLGDLAVAAAA